MRHSKALPGTPEDQHAPTMPLYSLPLHSKREPRHFAFISYRWFSGGSRAIYDEKEPYYGLCIVKDTLTEAHRLIIVMTFNDDSSASRFPPSSPSIPSKCVRQFMSHILLSAEMHNFPSGVAPFPGAETGTGDRPLHKGQPEKDMLVVKVGGPAYRIGLGGRAWTACCVCCRWAASAS